MTGLLAEPIGSIRELVVSAPALDLGPDLRQTEGVEGTVRLTRTNRGLLVHGRLSTAIEQVCSCCLRELEWPVQIEIDEEALPVIDFASGLPVDVDAEPDALRLNGHHELELEGEVGDAIRLAEPIAPLCREDCPGLCVECGQELAGGPHDHAGADVDPRLEVLRGFASDPERD